MKNKLFLTGMFTLLFTFGFAFSVYAEDDISSRLQGKWEVKTYDWGTGRTSTIPSILFDSMGFEFTKDSILAYNDGQKRLTIEAFTDGNSLIISESGAELIWETKGKRLSLDGGPLLTRNYRNESYVCMKVDKFSWEK